MQLTQPDTTGCACARGVSAKDCEGEGHGQSLLTRFPHEGIVSHD